MEHRSAVTCAYRCQALGHLLQDPKGLEAVSSLPLDEKSMLYLQQALGVLKTEPNLELILDPTKSDLTDAAPDAAAPEFPPEEQRRLVAEDWKRIQQRSKANKRATSATSAAISKNAAAQETSKRKGTKSMGFWKTSKGAKEVKEKVEQQEEIKELQEPNDAVAMDFHQLLAMNAGIIGANMSHLQLLSDLFEQLLAPHVNAQPGEAEIAADLLALRFFREAQGELQLKDFKTSMLASARALLPETWDTTHENAWIAVWDCIALHIRRAMPLPGRYVKHVQRFVSGQEEVKPRSSRVLLVLPMAVMTMKC
ncbi:unnamed protein product [Durusdinium trenchii]|uniref:Uncharacterized protein n=1 Tax=Durusdinium trenchii TaxID=1381693 RepID=A0ABP0ILG7_9DINO